MEGEGRKFSPSFFAYLRGNNGKVSEGCMATMCIFLDRELNFHGRLDVKFLFWQSRRPTSFLLVCHKD
jgi:hypothetical protein